MADPMIPAFYKGRHIFITGSTGFIGKVLVEKLLRSCPDLERIYLLMRPKKGLDVRSRLDKLLKAPIFKVLTRQHPERLLKLSAISGDITEPLLGLSEADQRMLQSHVSVVFHLAASVRFDEPLKVAVAMNLLSTRALTKLCNNFVRLEAFVHVSTAFSNCDQSEVLEMVYNPPSEPAKVISYVESLDEDILDSITPRLIKDRPNTYIFTKALTEHDLLKESSQLPIAIIRPSIVTASWKEPIPGWVDSVNGATGMMVQIGKGVVRTMLCNPDMVAEYIPVDVVINLMIAVSWHLAVTREKRLLVYNCTSGTTNPMKWKQEDEWVHEAFVKHPFSGVLWYPTLVFRSNRLINFLYIYVLHIIPAYFLDTLALLANRKPMMLTIHKKLLKSAQYLQYFTTNEWRFSNHNMNQLFTKMHPADQKEFNLNMKDLDWKIYLENYVLGIRSFVLREDLLSLETAKKEMRRLYCIHRLCQVLFLALVCWTLYSVIQLIIQHV